MSRIVQRSVLLPLILAGALVAPVILTDASSAHADVSVRVSGKIKVRIGVPRVRVRVRHDTWTPRPTVRLHVGRYAAPPPPPECDCGPDHVPAYYTPPAPVYAPPPPAPMVYQQAPAPLPRFALGVFAGSLDVENQEGADVGVFGRVRLTDRWLVEAEMGKTAMDDLRIDRRLGGALLFDLSPRSRLSAHVLAGMGVTQTELDRGAWRTEQEYGEFGAGLSYRLTPRIQLAGDLRLGARTAVDDAPGNDALKSVAPSADSEEQYTRGRLSAILSF